MKTLHVPSAPDMMAAAASAKGDPDSSQVNSRLIE